MSKYTWEQRKFKTVVKVNSGKDYKSLNHGTVPVYGTGGYMLSVDKWLSDQNGVGIGRKGTIDSPQLLEAPFWTVDTLFYLIPDPGFALLFIYSFCQLVNWKKLDESTGVPSLSKKTIETLKINIPCKTEQQKIGAIFAKLDSLIAANQRQQKSDRFTSNWDTS